MASHKKKKQEDFLGAFINTYTPASEKRLVISIDFGSTHCGVAYALTNYAEGEKPEVVGKVYGQKFSKEPTCALFDKKTRVLQEFGYEARSRYVEIAKDKAERAKYLYFEGRSIKMRLWDASLRFDAPVETVDGNGELPLNYIVSAILSRLKDEALDMATKGTSMTIEPSEALWVLTVPSIWQEADKQFMRKAAHRAKIIPDVASNDLILALEPECAVISAKNALPEFAAGQKLLCLDCGGGTVDICAVEVLNVPKTDNKDHYLRLRQLLEPTGGNWGSTYVDKNFLTFLAILVDDPRLEGTRFTSPGVVMEVLEEWEAVKTSLTHKELQKKLGTKVINISGVLEALEKLGMEHDLAQLVEKYNKKVTESHPEFAGVRAVGRKGVESNLELPMELLGTFFRPVLDMILDELKSLLDLPVLSGLNYVLLVGGFAESDVLRHEVRRITKRKGIRLAVPTHAAQVVQRGAVLYGLDPEIVSTRRCRQTIGIKVTMRLKDMPNPESEELQKHQFYDEGSGETVIREVFHPYVKKGQEIESSMVVKHNFSSLNSSNKKVKFELYATDVEDPKFVTDPGCVRLAKIVVHIDPESNPRLECMMRFASTEIQAQIKNKDTGKTQSIMLQYNNMGLQNKTNTLTTFVPVKVREIGPWGDNEFDDHFLKMSEML